MRRSVTFGVETERSFGWGRGIVTVLNFLRRRYFLASCRRRTSPRSRLVRWGPQGEGLGSPVTNER